VSVGENASLLTIDVMSGMDDCSAVARARAWLGAAASPVFGLERRSWPDRAIKERGRRHDSQRWQEHASSRNRFRHHRARDEQCWCERNSPSRGSTCSAGLRFDVREVLTVKLRPLGISTLRDRVCMTAAMLVLEPIFEADLPPEQCAYRPGRNAQQAVVEVEALLYRGRPEIVDANMSLALFTRRRKRMEVDMGFGRGVLFWLLGIRFPSTFFWRASATTK
jgi:hypothetical protein